MIPNDVIDKILDKTDIVEVLSGYIPIKKAGQNFKGLCPFHKEKTPSFMVSPAKQIFHCFGCGAGGNVISFLMKYEKMDFIEAVKTLADKAKIALPRFSRADKEKDSFADKLYNANNLACNLYQENLIKESGKSAYSYFIQRGLNEKTIKEFRLGFAEDAWQGLINHAKTKGVESDTLEKAGLALRKAEGANLYDRFRNRIIFTIFDLRKRILGFGARPLDESLPKYINSPETYVYRKGMHLYGLNFSKEYIRRLNYVIIVEGYFDLILPFQNDIKNIVATLGTALTVEQINLLSRFTKNAILVYDSDKAGQEATLRGLDLLIQEDMNVRIAVLPKGTDPDSFVRKEGRDGFMKILKESKDLFDYKLGTLTARFKKREPRGKTKIVQEMLPTLTKIKNAVLKSSYLKRMSEELSVDEEAIRTELKKVKSGFTRSYTAPLTTEDKNVASLAEITLLAVALENTESVKRIEKELGFRGFKNEAIGSIFEKIGDFHKKNRKIIPSHLISYFDDNKIEGIISEATSLAETLRDKDKVLEDCFRHILKNRLRESLNTIQIKIKEAEDAADTNEVNKLIVEYNKVVKKSI